MGSLPSVHISTKLLKLSHSHRSLCGEPEKLCLNSDYSEALKIEEKVACLASREVPSFADTAVSSSSIPTENTMNSRHNWHVKSSEGSSGVHAYLLPIPPMPCLWTPGKHRDREAKDATDFTCCHSSYCRRSKAEVWLPTLVRWMSLWHTEDFNLLIARERLSQPWL